MFLRLLRTDDEYGGRSAEGYFIRDAADSVWSLPPGTMTAQDEQFHCLTTGEICD